MRLFVPGLFVPSMQNARHLMFRPIIPDVSSHMFFSSPAILDKIFHDGKQQYFKYLITDITLVFYFKRVESKFRQTVRNKRLVIAKVSRLLSSNYHFQGDVGDKVSLSSDFSQFSAEGEV